MSKLIASLIFAVIASVVGIGWLMSQLYQHSIDDDEHPLTSELTPYRQIGEHIAQGIVDQSIADSPADQNLLTYLPSSADIQLSTSAISHLGLPPFLLKTFQQEHFLVLESQDGLSLYFLIPSPQSDAQSIPAEVLEMNIAHALIPRKKESSIQFTLTLAFYVGIMLSILIWLYPLIRRLVLLQKAAKKFGSGELSSRVKSGGLSYIADIENEFNAMAQRIESLIADNKLLSRAVSHDLKTPLARLRFGIDMLHEADDPSLREKYNTRLEHDLDVMESLINTLLDYAKLDDANLTIAEDDIALYPLVKKCGEEQQVDNKLISYHSDCQDAVLKGDDRYLKMLFNNVLKNAFAYAKRQVMVSIVCSKHQLIVRIEDDGPGIDSAVMPQVMKPFVRGNQAHGIKGHGMGLAIAERICHWHGGSIRLSRSESYDGALVKMTFTLKSRVYRKKTYIE